MKLLLIGFGRMGRIMYDFLNPEFEIFVMETNSHIRNEFPRIRFIDSADEIETFNPHCLLNAVPLNRTVQVFEKISSRISNHCVRMDMASVKVHVSRYYRQHQFPFVSFHPMFGPTFANLHKLEGEKVIFIDGSQTELSGRLESVFANTGLESLHLDFEQHDRLIATGLSLPFLMTMGFSMFRHQPAVPGSTYKKHLEISDGFLSEDESLVSEILLNPFSKDVIDDVVEKLGKIRHLVDTENSGGIRDIIRELKGMK